MYFTPEKKIFSIFASGTYIILMHWYKKIFLKNKKNIILIYL